MVIELLPNIFEHCDLNNCGNVFVVKSFMSNLCFEINTHQNNNALNIKLLREFMNMLET